MRAVRNVFLAACVASMTTRASSRTYRANHGRQDHPEEAISDGNVSTPEST